ncbi:GTP 3',8-cyclase MoaA [Aliiglaciecola lipolytica]|uniref:GTP 3',8-cyclase n=1 Tax=Aliiglaciecola lipolytica E3 TaxID=1127673 RepID=K6XS97_9ALTE|nr:GTP 3',8-cyclase MoaA [Aliiglaciecola lipolytica]GAC14556.1 molybdenum cofactor biosynthesis protein [Aliiglaciecola lipolytica E3]
MLEDKFGRRFHYLRLSVTDVCNFSCDYCLPDGYQCDSDRDFLRLSEIRQICSGFAKLGTQKIRITGGEPSLRKDLPEIIQIASTTPGIKQVAITTNGYRLAQQVESWFNAGLNSLNVSIDSLDPRMFASITGHNKLDTILTGISRALELGLKVKVNGVLMRQYNDNELERFLAWLKDTPITFRMIELMETGDNVEFFKRNHLSGEPIKQKLIAHGWTPVIQDKTAGPAQEFWHPDYRGKIGLIMPYSKDFCASCNRLRISATGKLHLCLFADKGLDIRPLLQDTDTHLLQQQLKHLLGDKEASHWLDQGFTGATKHLAMLGG